jgi:hypothetical protein
VSNTADDSIGLREFVVSHRGLGLLVASVRAIVDRRLIKFLSSTGWYNLVESRAIY